MATTIEPSKLPDPISPGIERVFEILELPHSTSHPRRIDQSNGYHPPVGKLSGRTRLVHSVLQRWLLILVGVLLVTASGLVDITYETPLDLIAFAMTLIGINAVLRPVLVVLTLPVTVLTLGFFALAVNALVFWLTAQLYWGVHVGSVFDAAFAALLLTIFTFVAGSLIR